jgi:hypothetical protein
MNKEIFKVGDRVFHIEYGWGEIIEEINCYDNLKIAFDKKVESWDWFDKSYISFTEYTLQGFSQERPIELPEVGELCLVRDYNDDTWLAREFAEYRHGLFICQAVHGQGEVEWKYMKRIKILD